MKVIARNNGPFYENYDGTRERIGLKEGKSYDVIEWSKHDGVKWVSYTSDFVNPKNFCFFIKVINESNIIMRYWNDYFLSSEEVRDFKLNQIGII